MNSVNVETTLFSSLLTNSTALEVKSGEVKSVGSKRVVKEVEE